MEGSTPDWADTEDYATLEEVFASRTFGQPCRKSQQAQSRSRQPRWPRRPD